MRCHNCGNYMAPTATSCPKCGGTDIFKTIAIMIVGIIAIILMMLVVAGSRGAL